MKRNYVFVLLSILNFSPLFWQGSGNEIFAQQGVNGPKVVGAANTVVNEYTSITAFIPVASTSITVASSSLNVNGRFAGNLQPGDLIMI